MTTVKLIIGGVTCEFERPETIRPSSTLIVLLKFAKGPYYQGSNPKTSLMDDLTKVLGQIYHPRMSKKDVIQVCVKAYVEMLQFPEFEMTKSVEHFVTDLVTSPFLGLANMSYPNVSWDLEHTMEEFYERILSHILSQFVITRIDWIREHFPLPVESS